MAMTVKKDNNEVRIQWRVADIKIPTSEIKNITQDQDIHAVPELDSKDVSRIGSTFGKTNRVIIDTEDHEYIIYTQNDQKVYNELTK
ncbi:Putative cytosolic protein [Staphylococcus aureus]|nr:Putative cytosolic protein [Staphylococcus aureus]CAC7951580.1 Putative cytosolic protein [Staphylococcus aureus]